MTLYINDPTFVALQVILRPSDGFRSPQLVEVSLSAHAVGSTLEMYSRGRWVNFPGFFLPLFSSKSSARN